MENLKVFLILSKLANNPYKDSLLINLKNKGVYATTDSDNTYSRVKIFFIKQVLRNGKPDILNFHLLHDFFVYKKAHNRIYFYYYDLIRFIKFSIFISQILILKIMKIKILWTVHEWHDKYGGNHIHKRWATILGKLLDGIITHCDTTRKDVIKGLNLEKSSKVFVVPHANYIGSYKNQVSQLESRKILNLPTDGLVFLFFGNIFPSKGIIEAIDSFIKLQSSKASLLIAGRPVDEKMEKLIKNKIEGRNNIFLFLKEISDDEIQFYMNSCDCILQPYKVFTTSGVTILSMSFGKVCIAPRVGYFNDVLDEAGSFLYDTSYEDGLLKAMKLADENHKYLAEMGKYNLQKVQQWNWNYVTDEIIKIFHTSINRQESRL